MITRREFGQQTLAAMAAQLTSLRDPSAVLEQTLIAAVRLLKGHGGQIGMIAADEDGVLRWGHGHSLVHDRLVAARAQATTDEFDEIYRRWRPMVERTLAWLTRGTNRKLAYRGVDRNQLWWAHRCAAVNLQRLVTIGLARTSDGGWATT